MHIIRPAVSVVMNMNDNRSEDVAASACFPAFPAGGLDMRQYHSG
jgi:hypothetical protein